MAFKRASSLGIHSAVPCKTIDILSDWAANSKSQLDLLKTGFKLRLLLKEGKGGKKKKKGESDENALIPLALQDSISQGIDAIVG